MPVGAPGRPLPDPVDDRIVGIGRCQRRASGRPPGRGRAPPRDARARPTRGSRRRSRPRRRRPAGRGPRPGRPRRLRAPGGRRPAEGRARRAGRRADPPGCRVCAAGPSTTSPARVATSPNAARCSLIPPARTTVRSRRRPAAAATSAASSPSARRSSAAGGSPAPTRTHVTACVEQHRGHRQRIDRLGAARHGPPAAPRGGREQRAERAFRGGHDGHLPWRMAGDLQPRQVLGGAASQVEGRGERPGRRPRPGRRGPR